MKKKHMHCDKRIETRLESLEKALRTALRQHLGRVGSASAEDPVEFMDTVARGETVDLAVRIAESDAAAIHQVREALYMLRQGTYGICRACGERISRRRLRAQPFATLCIRCKVAEEQADSSSPGPARPLRESPEPIEAATLEADDDAHAGADELFRGARVSELF